MWPQDSICRLPDLRVITGPHCVQDDGVAAVAVIPSSCHSERSETPCPHAEKGAVVGVARAIGRIPSLLGDASSGLYQLMQGARPPTDSLTGSMALES